MSHSSLRSATIALLHTGARWASDGLDVLYPPCCMHCGRPLDDGAHRESLCADCDMRMTDTAPVCPRCAGRLPVSHDQLLHCPACAVRPPRFDAAVRLGGYRDTLRDAVLRCKHRQEEPLLAALAGLLVRRRGQELGALNLSGVMPIPMHWTRRCGAAPTVRICWRKRSPPRWDCRCGRECCGACGAPGPKPSSPLRNGGSTYGGHFKWSCPIRSPGPGCCWSTIS